MLDFAKTLLERNNALFYFGLANLLFSLVFLLLTQFTTAQVLGVNAWYKPFKFAASIGIYAWTMAWFCAYLPASFNINLFNTAIIVLLGFEIVYIVLQAERGQLSHFNQSSAIYAGLYSLMALAASLVSLYTAYVGWLFFTNAFPQLPDYYLWAIRWAIVLFVVFSFEGFVMGARLSHTIGGPDGGPGLPLLNWSYRYGDPRIAHFIGMHALQVLPLLAYYALKDVRAVTVAAILYGILAVFTLVQALNGRALWNGSAL